MAVSEAILESLKAAIRAEREGHYFYKMAAQSTTDPMGKEAFEYLADEEQHHAEYLLRHYKSLMESGSLDKEATLGKPYTGGRIFSDALRSRAKEAHFEMTALSVGVQLEADAQRFYSGEADKTDDPNLKAFFTELAEWESGHYHALLAEQDALKKVYWAENLFSPF